MLYCFSCVQLSATERDVCLPLSNGANKRTADSTDFIQPLSCTSIYIGWIQNTRKHAEDERWINCIRRKTKFNVRTQCTRERDFLREIKPFSQISSFLKNSFSLSIQEMLIWNNVIKMVKLQKMFFSKTILLFPVSTLFCCKGHNPPPFLIQILTDLFWNNAKRGPGEQKKSVNFLFYKATEYAFCTKANWNLTAVDYYRPIMGKDFKKWGRSETHHCVNLS